MLRPRPTAGVYPFEMFQAGRWERKARHIRAVEGREREPLDNTRRITIIAPRFDHVRWGVSANERRADGTQRSPVTVLT
jgi:hypothetical protein